MKKMRLSIKLFLSALVFIAIALVFTNGTGVAGDKYKEEKLTAVQNAVRRAAVSCYAIEGVYPPDVQYMKDNYGLAVDEKKYTLIYIIYGSNMMPDIDVLPLGEQVVDKDKITQMSVQ